MFSTTTSIRSDAPSTEPRENNLKLLVFGRAGMGKSDLIRQIWGLPEKDKIVTRCIHEHKTYIEDYPEATSLSIFDNPGFLDKLGCHQVVTYSLRLHLCVCPKKET